MSGADDKTPGAASIDGDDFVVLVNGEGQHSIWPGETAVPEGWSAVGPRGPKDVCIAYIEAIWTDMRPRSLTAGPKRKSASRK